MTDRLDKFIDVFSRKLLEASFVSDVSGAWALSLVGTALEEAKAAIHPPAEQKPTLEERVADIEKFIDTFRRPAFEVPLGASDTTFRPHIIWDERAQAHFKWDDDALWQLIFDAETGQEGWRANSTGFHLSRPDLVERAKAAAGVE